MIDDKQTPIFSVSELNSATKCLLEGSFSQIWVRGEVSNLARPSSGHCYFSLKDAYAQIRCALFKTRGNQKTVDLQNGAQVIACAKVSIYPDRGDYQLIVESLILDGEGQLQLAFNALKKALAALGWFDEARKRPLPTFPSHIGVITSPTGAALRDVLAVLKRRCPLIPVVVYGATVQGNTAAPEVVKAIQYANAHAQCDVLILTRGGGSLEDLWPFNEKIVAQAIFQSAIPIVSAIGHEVDFTISDFVADKRAPTPSAAAEMVSPDQEQLLAFCHTLQARLIKAYQNQLFYYAQQLDWLHRRLSQAHPLTMVVQWEKNFQVLMRALHVGLTARLSRYQQQLGFIAQQLDTLSPLATLARGYVIAKDAGTQDILTSVKQLAPQQRIEMQFCDGSVFAFVAASD